MSLRVRRDGSLLCAAKHPELPSDLGYIDDGLHYVLGIEQRVLVPDDDEEDSGKWHWRSKGEPFRTLPRDPSPVDPVNDFGYDEEFWKG